MKKKIAIFALIAIFVSVCSLTAQTKTVSKTTTTTKTEVKAEKKALATPACCAAKDAACCKGKSAAEKAKCIEKCSKATAKDGTKACTAKTSECSKTVETKKVVTKKI